MSFVLWKEEILKIRIRLEAGEKVSYRSLGKEYGVSRERIRQVFKEFQLHKLHFENKFKIKNDKKEEKIKQTRRKRGTPSDYDPILYKTLRLKFSSKKINARRSGIQWDLDFGYLVFPEYCPVLGIKIDYFAETRQENSMSWDRTDPNKGYINGNVKIISWRANRIKNDGTLEEHQKIVDYLSSLR